MARCFVVLLGLLTSAAVGCGLDIGPSGEGRACSLGRCSPGYVCNAQKRCVAPSRELDAGGQRAGSGGASDGAGGSGGRTGSDGGASGTSVSGGAADRGSGGQGGSGGASGNATIDDAGTDPDSTTSVDGSIDASAECREPTRYYRDRDGDGFGAGDARSFCGAPPDGWVVDAGDCNDSDARVFPGQTRFFGESYTKDSVQSFDYDCSGTEEPAPNAAGAAPNCPALGLVVCLGTGYGRTGRSGPGVDPTCGSTAMITCTGLLACAATTTVVAPKECR